ncbi:MAG: N-acetylmuramoyl-L-alanine amidase [Bacillota bacterium]
MMPAAYPTLFSLTVALGGAGTERGMQRPAFHPKTSTGSAPRFVLVALCAAALLLAAPQSALAARPPSRGQPRFAALPMAGRVFVVDPGHGGIDGGCSAAGYLEKEVVLPIGLELTRLLRAAGARVGLTRNQDMELGHMNPGPGSRHRRDLATRVAVARRLGPDLMISLHVNAASSGRMQGSIAFYPPGRVASRRIALRLMDRLRALVPGNQNAVLPGNLYVLRHVPYPVVLVELGFLTHPDDRAVLTSPDGQRALALSLYDGIADHFADEARSLEETPPGQGRPVSSGAPSIGLLAPEMAAPRAFPAPAAMYDEDLCPHHETP